MIIKCIERYPVGERDFLCKDEKGNIIVIDLFTDSNIEGYDYNPDLLVGKEFECDYLTPHSYIAMGVRDIRKEVKNDNI